MTHDRTATAPRFDRRTFLAGTTAASLLAACSGGSSGDAATDDAGSGVRSLDDSHPSSASGSLWPLIDSDGPDTVTHDSGRGWMRLAIALTVVVVMVVAVLLAFNLGQRSSVSRLVPGGSETSSDASQAASGEEPSAESSSDGGEDAAPWPVRRAIDFDPEGDGSENPEVAADAIDASPSTAWRTLEYRNNPELGGLKSGVGLVLDLGTQRPVSSVDVLLRGGPSSLQIIAAPGRGRIPDSRAGFTLVGRNQQAPSGRSTIDVAEGTTTRYIGLWFTRLPQISSGDYQVQVAGVAVRR